jgi:CheY-like chemotaxis protein
MKSTVLLVDDEVLFLSSLAEALARAQPTLKVRLASNGALALSELKRGGVDLVVTDLKMPVMDGFELIAAIQNQFPSLPVVVMSAFGTNATAEQLQSLGVIHFVDKPVDLPSLLVKIDEILTPQVSGALKGVSLASFLQLLAMERKTTTVQVKSHLGITRLYFREGTLVHAENGGDHGLAVALRTVGLERAAIELVANVQSDMRSIEMSLGEMLLEAARISDDEQRFSPLEAEVSFDFEASGTRAPSDAKRPMNVKQCLAKAMDIEGALGAALVDHRSGLTLGTIGGGPALDMELAAAGNTNVIRAKMQTLKSLGLSETIDDILITLDSQFHILRPLEKHPECFLYIAINRERGNLGLARVKLKDVERHLDISSEPEV